MKKIFEVQQKISLLANEYHILKDDKQAAYVKQKVFALREHFSLFRDKSQTEILATSQARQIMDFSPVFDVLDPSGKHLGTIKKEFKKSLVRSSWSVYEDTQLQKLSFRLEEKNLAVAVFRRLWNFIPFANELPPPIKFHFSILDGHKTVGEYQKLTWIRDHYALSVNETKASEFDERVWMILAILLDAMQSR